MPSVIFSRRSEQWKVLGHERRGGDNGELVLMDNELSSIKAADLKRALAAHADYWGLATSTGLLSAVPEHYFDEGPYRDIELIFDSGALLVAFMHLTTWPADADEVRVATDLRRLLEPLVASYRSSVRAVQLSYAFVAPDLAFEITLQVDVRGRTAQDLVDIAEAAQQLCAAFATGTVNRESAAGLIRGGAAHLLEGQREGSWLEAKSQEYDLTTLRGAISLAQAVARFCNAEEGGLIVIGAQTSKSHGDEIIHRVRGIAASRGRVARYHQVINHRVYPPPFALRVEQLGVEEGRSIILIDLPPQPEELKPFLVHGAILADGTTEGAFISVVQRRGEGSIPITAPMIHASLAAGRALLRGANSPGRSSDADDPSTSSSDAYLQPARHNSVARYRWTGNASSGPLSI
ncbi:hypothetical protein [Microbacterium enclense]|uniref:hypothetical protein n=1 Tax=Microbacterium enclense TaxID=993073 RepID=UPI003442CBA3